MKTNYEIRYAAHPEDAKHYDTARLRRDFLIEKVFSADEVNMVYSMYDRMVVGGAMPNLSDPSSVTSRIRMSFTKSWRSSWALCSNSSMSCLLRIT